MAQDTSLHAMIRMHILKLMKIAIPPYIQILLRLLIDNGYEAHIVGGAVRDALLNRAIHDYDITTNATPEQMKQIFHSYQVLETGIKHGTLTVMNEQPVEITTYRFEKDYDDHRHPSSVVFTTSLKQDCARRDFTINALCYNETDGIVDFFGGQEDLNHRIIRAIHDPNERFNEDALRILRALRQAAELGFTIEQDTQKAIHAKYQDLSYVSKERIQEELSRLLTSKNPKVIIDQYPDVFSYIMNDTYSTVGLTTDCSALPVRLALLLQNAQNPKNVLTSLKYSNDMQRRVLNLIALKDESLDNRIRLKKVLCKLIVPFDTYLAFRSAMDISLNTAQILSLYQSIKVNNECYRMDQLCIHGNDVMALGLKGKTIRDALESCLSPVIEEKIKNDPQECIRWIKQRFQIVS